jgi:ATP-dependent DNA helicase PIF1
LSSSPVKKTNWLSINKDLAQVADKSSDIWKTDDGIILCPEQIEAAKQIHEFNGQCLLLTGNAGSGKSTVIRALSSRYPGKYRMSATTGRASMLIGGTTVDTLFCFSRDTWDVWSEDYLFRVMENCPRRIVIDEASMIGNKMANVLGYVAKQHGRILILVGDWAQCSPVKDSWPTNNLMFQGIKIIKLKENHRQHESDFMNALNDLRDGIVSEETAKFFQSRVSVTPPNDDRYVRMYATNEMVRQYNHQRLFQLLSETGRLGCDLYCHVKDVRTPKTQERSPLRMDKAVELVDSSNLANGEPIAVGARVMITRNAPVEVDSHGLPVGDREYVNGDTGELLSIKFSSFDIVKSAFVRLFGEDNDEDVDSLVSWDKLTPEECAEQNRLSGPQVLTVKLDRTGKEVQLCPVICTRKNAMDKVEYEITGLPIRLGWAATIHKLQGSTVDRAWVDIGSISKFPVDGRHGLAYVALSRSRNVDGLLISNWDDKVVWADPKIKTFL